MSQKKKTQNQVSKEEKRRAPRKPVLESFSLFVTVPKKGGYKLTVHDLSTLGLSFDYDTEGEDPNLFPIKTGEFLEIEFYLNQTLYLPLRVRVTRIVSKELREKKPSMRQIGAEIDQSTKAYLAYKSFVEMLSQLSDSAKIA